MAKHTLEELYQWQQLPLSIKVRMTKERIREWIKEYGEDGVYVAFSGGKDSTVLLDLVRQDYPEVVAVFVDVPTQYPELKQFATSFPNVTVLHPKTGYKQVVETYGFPFISKEVAECVHGARIYLTEILKQANLDRQTDRQTDSNHRINIGTTECAEQENTVNFPKPLVNLQKNLPCKILLGGVR